MSQTLKTSVADTGLVHVLSFSTVQELPNSCTKTSIAAIFTLVNRVICVGRLLVFYAQEQLKGREWFTLERLL